MPLTSVTIVGTYIKPNGQVPEGTVEFTLSARSVSAANNLLITRNPIVASLDVSGHFSVVLFATDQPVIQPTSLTYKVTERIAGDKRNTYNIEVPVTAGGTTIDLADIVPVAPASTPPATYALQSALAAHLSDGAAHAGATPDATAGVKGKVQLAGDLGGTAAAPTVPGLAGKAALGHGHGHSGLTGIGANDHHNQAHALGGADHTGSLAQSSITNLVSDLAAKAADTSVVHLTGSETITGVKTMSTSLSGITLTMSFNNTNHGGGCAGLVLERSATASAVPQSIIFRSGGTSYWAIAQDGLSGDMVIAAELAVAAEPGVASDVIRLSRRDDDATGTNGTGASAKAVFALGAGSPANEPADWTFIGRHQFVLSVRNYDSSEGAGGLYVRTYGVRKGVAAPAINRPSILLEQMKSGIRTTSIDFGNTVGFRFVVDPDGANTNDFSIVDLTNGLRRFNIRSDGSFFYSTFIGVSTGTTFAPATALHVKGSAVNSGDTSLRLENTSGMTFQIQSGIIGVTESGFAIRDVTNNIRRLVITSAGTIRFSEGDIATNATDGFIRIPVCNGAPTGTPTSWGGDSGGAMVFNRSDGKLHVYINGVGWRGVTLT